MSYFLFVVCACLDHGPWRVWFTVMTMGFTPVGSDRIASGFTIYFTICLCIGPDLNGYRALDNRRYVS